MRAAERRREICSRGLQAADQTPQPGEPALAGDRKDAGPPPIGAPGRGHTFVLLIREKQKKKALTPFSVA